MRQKMEDGTYTIGFPLIMNIFCAGIIIWKTLSYDI